MKFLNDQEVIGKIRGSEPEFHVFFGFCRRKKKKKKIVKLFYLHRMTPDMHETLASCIGFHNFRL